MERNKRHPDETKQRLFIHILLDCKGVGHHHCGWQRPQGRQGGWKADGQRKGRLQLSSDGRRLAWESCRQTNHKWASYVIGVGGLVFLQLVLNRKPGQNLEKLALMDQILTIWGQLLRGCGLASWTGRCRGCRPEFYVSMSFWPLSFGRLSLASSMWEFRSLCILTCARWYHPGGDGGGWCPVVCSCPFTLHWLSANDSLSWTPFHVLVSHLSVFFGEVPVKVLPMFCWAVCFLIVESEGLFIYILDVSLP